MLSDEVIEKVVERLAVRMEQANTYVLEEIGKSVKKLGTLTPSKAQQLIQIMRYGGDYKKIVRKIKELTKLNIKDIEAIFKEVAKNDYQFAEQFYKYRNKKYISWEENKQLQSQVKALAKITAKEYVNMTRTLAFATYEKGRLRYTKLSKMYQQVLDEAVLNVGQGKETFDSAMYRILKQLGESGIRTVDYASGRSIRVDSATRMLIKGGLRNMHNEIQQQFGEEFNSDGIEVSVHLNPAPDHMFVQGRQFSNEEFEKFQNDEDAESYDGIKFPAISEETGHDRRAISQYNCYHYIFSIVLGVSEPEYSNKQLQEIIDNNNKGFDFDGKHYTMYEGTQLQRKLEAEIRKQKDIQILAKSSGNDILVNDSQQKITQLTNKYKELSEASKLPAKMDRMRISGYRRTKIDIKNLEEIEYARKHNYIWHSTENLEGIIKDNKILSPSISVGKRINAQVRYGSQFIEFKPEFLQNVEKDTLLYRGDGGNKFTKEVKQFDNLMQMLKDNPKIYNELKFNNDLEVLKYIKKIYIRDDEPQEIIKLLKENNIEYELYKDYRERMFKKRK